VDLTKCISASNVSVHCQVAFQFNVKFSSFRNKKGFLIATSCNFHAPQLKTADLTGFCIVFSQTKGLVFNVEKPKLFNQQFLWPNYALWKNSKRWNGMGSPL